jgi:hypothetical protein
VGVRVGTVQLSARTVLGQQGIVINDELFEFARKDGPMAFAITAFLPVIFEEAC